jgi:hypothetical protein
MRDRVDALVNFFESWRQCGIGDDGLPLFEEVVMIRLAKPPLLSVERVASDDDKEDFRDAWLLFEKQRKARDTTVKGYPLVLWPVITPVHLKMLAARDIVTVEQLAALAEKRAGEVLPEIMELALRAKKLVAMQGKVGKYEEIIHQLTGERDMLAEQLKEANQSLAAQNAVIGALKLKVA